MLKGKNDAIPWTRRTAIGACLCCLAQSVVLGAEAVEATKPARPDFALKTIGPEIWMHTSWSGLSDGQSFPSNGIIIAGRNRILMIDTAWKPDQTEQLMTQLGPIAAGQPIDLFITHFHDDRIGGLGVTAADGITSFAFPKTMAEAERHALGRIVEAFYPGPAHTVDNAVVFDRMSAVLFGGCTMRSLMLVGSKTKDLGNVADADVSRWAATVARVAMRYPDTVMVVPGHGATGEKDVLNHTIELASK